MDDLRKLGMLPDSTTDGPVENIRPRYVTDAIKLYHYLKKASPGDEFLWAELGALIGTEVNSQAKHSSGYRSFVKARGMLLRDGVHVTTLRGLGIRMSTNEDCFEAMESNRSRIRKLSRQTLKVIDALPKPDKMDADDHCKVATERAIAQFSNQLTRPSRVAALVEKLAGVNPINLEEEARKTIAKLTGDST